MFEAWDKLKAHIAASFGIFGLIVVWNIIGGTIAGLGDSASYLAMILGPVTWVIFVFARRNHRPADHVKAAVAIFLLTAGFRIFFYFSVGPKESFVMALALGPALWLNIQTTLYYRTSLL